MPHNMQNVGTYILYIACNVFNVSEILCVAYGMGLHFSYIADLSRFDEGYSLAPSPGS